jgi:endonuclease-3
VKREEDEVPHPDHVASAVTPDAPSSLPTVVSSVSVTQKVDTRPTPQECQWVVDSLSRLHPEVVERNSRRRREILSTCGMQDTIVDGVISTILSQNTTSANSTNAFRRLKQAFPTWKSFIKTENAVPKMQEAIRCAGLSEIKAGRINAMLQTLQEEQGGPSFEYLRELSNDQVKTELTRFKGLGPKTISCVLLFAMGRDEFPVDTHVHRISKLMGFVPSSMNAEKTYLHLNKVVPDPLKLDLHCLLIAHGKQCHRCAARGKPQFPPKDGTKLSCPLVNIHKQKGKLMVMSIQIKKESS